MGVGWKGRPGWPAASLGLLAAIAAVQLLVSTPAWAYLDPGTGSYVFQLATAALVGGLFALKVFWGRITRLFRRSDHPPRTPDP